MNLSNVMTKFKPSIVLPSSKHTASVIFLHGSGSNGPDMRDWIKMCFLGKDMVESNIRFIYPTAPLRPYSAANGMMSNVWFDRENVTPEASEHNDSMEEMCREISKMIEVEVESGIPRHRVILGGFSMGGALSLYYGLQYGKGLAGVFCLSSFLSDSSKLYQTLRLADPAEFPPVFQTHGHKDDIVLCDWGKRTNSRLSALGVKSVFYEYPTLYHQLSTQEMKDLRQWLLQRLPSNS